MTLLIFLVGVIVFTLFVTSSIWEIMNKTKQEKIDLKNYYERFSYERKKEPKRKKGSQSRRKHYFWKQ